MLQDEFPTTFLYVDSHHGDAFETAETNERWNFYNLSAAPSVLTDGRNLIEGAGSCQSAYAAYRSQYMTRMNAMGGNSPVSITGCWAITGDTATIDLIYTLLDPVALGTVRATVFIYEDDVYYNSATSFDKLTRSIKHEAVTTLVNPGDQVAIQKAVTIGANWDQSKLHCIAILQKNTTADKQIWQAASVPYLVDFTVSIPEKVASVPQASGDAYFHGTISNDTGTPDVITLSFDTGFAWPTAYQIEGDPNWYTGPASIDFPAYAGKEITLRVSTDDQHMIDSGNFRAQSQNSGRLAMTTLRVFNGSYSVLLVDDDGMRTDETPWLNAFSTHNYLYEEWDVTSGHGGSGPRLENMAGFDVVIWQHGFFTSNLLASADTTNLKLYLDGGGALLLSSMDYINYQPESNGFVKNYLGVQYPWDPGVGAAEANGVGGDPVSDGMDMTLSRPTGSANRVDQVDPRPEASTIFTNEDGLSVAVRHSFGDARVVYCTIPQNAFPTSGADPNNSTAVAQRMIQWLVNASGGANVEEPGAPVAGGLFAAPNPLVRSAELSFALSPRAAAEPVRLTVVDPAGRLVRTLVAGRLDAGSHRFAWDGRDETGRSMPSGIYFARLDTADGRDGRKVVLMK